MWGQRALTPFPHGPDLPCPQIVTGPQPSGPMSLWGEITPGPWCVSPIPPKVESAPGSKVSSPVVPRPISLLGEGMRHANDCGGRPEGRTGQDDVRALDGDVPGGAGAPGPGDRLRRPGERHVRPAEGGEAAAADALRGPDG